MTIFYVFFGFSFCFFFFFPFFYFLSFLFFFAVLVSRWQQQTLCFDELINISPGSWELRHALLRCVLPLPRSLCRERGIFFPCSKNQVPHISASSTSCRSEQPPGSC